jgi:Tfp pilus assembly major pilin PilA
MRNGVNNLVDYNGRSKGYTIVETMIFLIISGVLLTISLLFFSGRQQRTQFTQGVREIEANVKTIMGEVSSGYYPNNETSFTCTAPASDSVPTLSPGSTKQGSNESCIFIGKVLNFDSSEKYTSYTVVGRRIAHVSQQIVSTLDEANPTIDDRIKEVYTMPWGIRATRVVSVKGTANPNRTAVGLIMALGGYTSGGDVISGAQSSDLLPLGDTFGESFGTLQTKVELMTDSARRPDKIVVCLVSGGGDRKGAIVLGGGGKQMSAESFIDAVPTECD